MSNAPVYALILVAGVVIAVQSAVNGNLGRALGNPMQATLASFLIGTLGASIYCVVQAAPLPSGSAIAAVPWWGWSGGLLGVFFVTSAIYAVPKIGVSLALTLVVTGQLLAGLLIDGFGLCGAPVRPITWGRVAGVLMVAAGTVVAAMSRE